MSVLFRADANNEIGSGHLMRCLALARRLNALGKQCTFICRSDGLGTLADKIHGDGFDLISLPNVTKMNGLDRADGLRHSSWLPGGMHADAENCILALRDFPPASWLVVDHYSLDARWETAMRDCAMRILAIDDLADRHHACDLLLDQNLMPAAESRYNGLVETKCEYLLGPRFALLRDEFGTPRSKAGVSPRRLFVMFGGADIANLTMSVAEVLAEMGWTEPVDFVVGPLYQHLDELCAILPRLPGALLHVNPQNIASLMYGASLAIGAPGVSSWERCACALPTIAIAQADNQVAIGQAMARAGANSYLGRRECLDRNLLAAEIEILWSSPKKLARMGTIAAGICDGLGAVRVAQTMNEYESHHPLH